MNAHFFSIILVSLIMSSCNAQSQKLTPLFEIEGSYLENGYLIVPKFQIKSDDKSILYHKGKVCFVPSDSFSLCIYEVFSDKYIIITPVSEKNKENSAIYMLPKNEIKIYSLSSGKIFDVHIKSKQILEINESKKKIIIEDFNKEKEILDLK